MRLPSLKTTVMPDERSYVSCVRKQVRGGWLVSAAMITDNGLTPMGLTFVPDPDHSWSDLEFEATGKYTQ
jgi:hypothetical protein